MVNVVILVGEMSRDLKVSPAGNTEMGSFGIKIENSFNGKTFTRYIDVSVFGKAIQDVKARKGDVVAITGRLDSYKDGDTYRLRVTAEKVSSFSEVPAEDTKLEAF